MPSDSSASSETENKRSHFFASSASGTDHEMSSVSWRPTSPVKIPQPVTDYDPTSLEKHITQNKSGSGFSHLITEEASPIDLHKAATTLQSTSSMMILHRTASLSSAGTNQSDEDADDVLDSAAQYKENDRKQLLELFEGRDFPIMTSDSDSESDPCD